MTSYQHDSANWKLKRGECLLKVSTIARIVNTMALNDWTHFSSWRLWFVCKALANSQMPSFVILFSLRLQNVREQQRRKGVKIVAKWLEEEEMVDKRGCNGVVGNELIIVTVYHMIRLPLIFSTGLGMTL